MTISFNWKEWSTQYIIFQRYKILMDMVVTPYTAKFISSSQVPFPYLRDNFTLWLIALLNLLGVLNSLPRTSEEFRHLIRNSSVLVYKILQYVQYLHLLMLIGLDRNKVIYLWGVTKTHGLSRQQRDNSEGVMFSKMNLTGISRILQTCFSHLCTPLYF